MGTLVYVDTNIFLDYFLDRKNTAGRSLGGLAWRFFHYVLRSDIQLLISRKVLEELYGALENPGQATFLFEMLKSNKKLRIIEHTPQELEQARQLDTENRNDALHALLAQKHGATYIITRNLKDFRKFSFLIEPKLPEDF